MNTYQKAIDWLDELSSEGAFFRANKKPSLATVNTILDKLERPDRSFEYRVVVGGTAGKGTICMLTEDVLIREGKTVATIMSPHLQVVTERIRINGKLISVEDFGNYILQIKNLVTEDLCPTYYEAIVLAGILAAKASGCEILITEVGLGGELDAVNAVQGDRISALTFIGNDHMDILGGSLEAIAKTKAGIFTTDTVYALSAEKKFTDILQKKSPIPIEWVKGIAQKMSKKMARKICEKILGSGGFTMQKVQMPARWEKIGNVILDGAHAAPRFNFIHPKIKKIQGKKVAIIAMTKNHEPADLSMLLSEFDEIFWVDVPGLDRDFWKPSEFVAKLGIGSGKFPAPSAALCYAEARYPEAKIFVLGSFFLCGMIRDQFYSRDEIRTQQTMFPDEKI